MGSPSHVMNKAFLACGILVAAMVLVWSATIGDLASDEGVSGGRPARWAQRVEKPGLPNFHKVSNTLYRGAQPTAEGFAGLKDMGVKTVVNLRSFHSDRRLLGNTGLQYEHITMKAWHAEDKEVARFLKIATDPARQPVFVHCQHGADRTGAMCAIYRVVVEGWSKEQAIREMREGGYGFFEGWKNLVKFIEDLDVESVRQQIGQKAE